MSLLALIYFAIVSTVGAAYTRQSRWEDYYDNDGGFLESLALRFDGILGTAPH